MNDTNKEEKNPYAPPVVPEGATPSGASPSEASHGDDADRPVPMTAFERRFKHPPGLVILFFAEMWERFSYYGMRGLLTIYMTNYLFVNVRQRLQDGPFSEAATGDPNTVFGWSAVQKFADFFAGTPTPEQLQLCVDEKAKLLVAGDATNHIAPLAEDLAHKIAHQVCVASPRASILYGMYTGFVYLTPFIGGIVADRLLGQRKTVVVGGIIMAIGHFVMAIENSFFLALFLLIIGNGAFKPNISTQVGNLYPEGDPRRDGAFTIFYMGINLGAFISNFVCGTLAAVYGWHYGFAAAGVGMVLGLITYMAKQNLLAPDNLAKKKAAAASSPTPTAAEDKRPLDKGEWTRVWALVALCALNVVFWAVYEQQGNTMQKWATDRTQWYGIPSNWFQSFNPACIFALAIPLDMFWRWQNRRGSEPSSVSKMAIGSVILGLSFVVMIIGVHFVGDGKGSMFWPLFCTLLLTVGELYLSPIGLSLVTKVSPKRIVSMMMGMWFLSSFLGNILSGQIGVFYDRWPKDLFFALLTVLGISAGVAMFAFNKPLKKALGDH